ncbi:MAG TPA: hypothetical protein VMG09_17040 [Bacteroidota bacterium]|nr:hypothetical protein [Bacteroidota bacterium]
MCPLAAIGRRSTERLLIRMLSLAACLGVIGSLAQSQEYSRPENSPLPTTADSLLPRNASSVLMDRNLDIFTWNGRLFLDTSFAGIRANIKEQYGATVVQLASDPTQRLQSNQQQASVSLTVPIAGPLAATGRWNSFIFTDSRGIGLSAASMHSTLAGLLYTPIPALEISPSAGYRWDNQSGFRDRGPSYQLLATLHTIDEDGYLVKGNGQLHFDRLSPRQLVDNNLQAGVERSFGSYSNDSMEVAVYQLRREFYAPDSSIESRQETYVQFVNLLGYNFSPTIKATAYVSVISHQLDKLLLYGEGLRPHDAFDTRVDEFNLDTYLETSWRPLEGRSSASVRFGHYERDELHNVLSAPEQTIGPLLTDRTQQEQSKNNLASQNEISGHAFLPLSWSDEVSVSGRASLLRYDTPSNLNDEDRDELLVTASVGTLHRISPIFTLGVTLEGTVSHLVYLLSDRSANNNINRVLRLTPIMEYRPAWFFRTTNGFEVLASYTVYDFEQSNSSVQSYTYRQFGWIDSTSMELTNRIGLDFFAYLKLYERGQLNWDQFTERLENSYVDKTVSGQVRFSPLPTLMFAVGLRFFSQVRYVYDENGKSVDSYLRSLGPTCSVLWYPGPHSVVDFRGWYENRRQTDGSVRGLPSLTLTLLYNF